MSTDKLKLEVLLAAKDKITGPLKAIMGGSNATAQALKAAKDQLKGLNVEQAKIRDFNKTVESARQASAAYKEQKTALEALNAKHLAAKESQSAMVGALRVARREHAQLMKEFAKNDAVPGLANKLYLAKQALDKLEGGYNKAVNSSRRLREEAKQAAKNIDLAKKSKDGYSDALKRVTTELKDAGIGTKNLSDRQEKLKASIALATMVAEKHGKTMQRLSAAQATYDKSMAMRNSIAGAGVAGVGAGAALGVPIVKAVKDFMSFEDAMLGVARQVDGARDANGKLTATYYEMGESIKAMAERIPLATTQIAAIVESGARMGIQGKENLLAFAEATAVMTTAFDLPADQIGESIGKLSNLYNVPIKDIKQLGDAINYLDDNAQSKGGDIINVMQRIAGTAAMVKMSYKDAAALGSTFLSLGSTPEIAATASNAMIRELSIATMQTKRFKEGLGMLKMDAKSIQFGMNKDATGTIIKVLEAIKSLPEEKQLEAATRLFGKEYGDDAAKLAEKLDEYRRQLKLVNAEKSKGSMDREAAARNEVLSARLEMAKNAVFNLSSELGSSLKPALTDILEVTASVIRGIRDWVKEHPQLTGVLMKTAAALAAILVVFGSLAIGFAAFYGSFAVLRLGFGLFAIHVLPKLLVGIGFLRTAFTVLFAVIRANPLGLLLTLGGFAISYLMTRWSTLMEMFKNGNWAGIGMMIIKGIESGLDALTMGLYTKIKNIAFGMADSAKAAFGINSPSRVFAEIGGYTMAGLENGLLGGKDGPLSAVLSTVKALTAAGAGMVIGGAALAIPLDTRPPIGGAAAGGMGGGAATYIINVYPQAGSNAQDIAKEVEKAMAQIEARKQAGQRSSLRDKD